MTDDPILQELRRIRDEHAATFGYDVRAMLRDLKATQREDEVRGQKYVRLSPKHPEPAGASQ